MTNVFYCRISTNSQNDERQLKYAKELNIEKKYIFNDQFTGTTMKRKEFERMNQFLKNGDVVYIESLSRLGRTVGDIIKAIETWKEKGINFVSKNEFIDTRNESPINEALYVLFSLYSKIELEQNKQRCREGIKTAKMKGKQIGRKKIEDSTGFKNKKVQLESAVQERLQQNTSLRILSKKYGISVNTIYRYIKEHNS